MRIGFDARMMTHPGIGRYIGCLLREMIKQAGKDEFLLFGDPEHLQEFRDNENVKLISWKAPVYSIKEQITLPYNAEKIDLLHVPHFNIPVFYRGKMVVTTHDLIYLLFAGSAPSALAKYYARFMIGTALKKAKGVIAVSKHTRDDLVKVFGSAYSDKIKVIYEAADKAFHQEDIAITDLVRRKYHLSDKVILYAGSVKPHKNVATLLKVYKLLKKWGAPHQLVIVGKWDKKENYLKPMMADENIRYLGEVPFEDLEALYCLSDVLVHLSLYEGFGLTVLEAMQCGTPVVVSEKTSLPEVAGEAALTVPPLNVEQIADSVFNVLVNSELRAGMIGAGLERAKQFSWERAARETLELYRSI